MCWISDPNKIEAEVLTYFLDKLYRLSSGWYVILGTALSVLLNYRKTPLISTYVFSGLATVQVLIFGGRTYFRGYDKAGWKILPGRSLFNLVLSVENTLLCMFQRLCTYFQDKGYLYLGGMYFRGIAADSKFQEKMKGTYYRRGTFLQGFTVTKKKKKTNRNYTCIPWSRV